MQAPMPSPRAGAPFAGKAETAKAATIVTLPIHIADPNPLSAASVSLKLFRMRDDLLSRAFPVESRRAAAAFSDPLRRRVVLLLIGRERSAGELASVTGVELKRLHYHLSALERLGLVVVTRRRARAGRPVKLYRAAADAFFVPAEAMAASPSESLAAELRQAQARFADPSGDGVLYHLTDGGEFLMRPVTGLAARKVPTADRWRVLQLSPAEALRLAAEVDACLKAAVARSRGTTRAYLTHFAFAPQPDSAAPGAFRADR